MTIQAAIAGAASGDNMIGHVVTAASLGSGISGFVMWGFQLAHLNPPVDVISGTGIICTVLASWILQKVFS